MFSHAYEAITCEKVTQMTLPLSWGYFLV